MKVPAISPEGLAELFKAGKTVELLDVRTPAEFQEVHVESARNVPLDRLDPAGVIGARGDTRDEPLYIVCRSGGRSLQACQQFIKAGFANVVNVDGGTLACIKAGLPVVRSGNAATAGGVIAGIASRLGLGRLLGGDSRDR